MSAATTFQAGDGTTTELREEPITPEDVLEGDPLARSSCLLRADDERLSTSVWDCTAGRFSWSFGYDEIVHIVAGEVTVTDEQGRARTLGVGDVALFQRGTTTVWHVREYVRKIAVHRVTVDPLPVRALRKVRRVVADRRAA